jgi:formylglycine-generating enzyme required for sulfatase activity
VRTYRLAAEWARDDLFALEAPQTLTLPRPFRLVLYGAVGDYRAFVAAGGYRTPAW